MNAAQTSHAAIRKEFPLGRGGLTLVINDDETKITLYRLARIVYAETRASSLRAVEALASMIGNLCVKSARPLSEIATDDRVFESLRKDSARQRDLFVDSARPEFQMCLRAVRRMMSGRLADSAIGATRFHRAEHLPEWAVACGSIAETDGLFFYA